ncbi:hypothetical protein BB561_003615 [Smittium simulii]|uniref:Uncharacterized protein n=1 Tax=Smittium simulii TaxID=133385 RepID=A0A2T9YKE8_9FUNG|nr:hypothetical protein BB561_003615 [Smittium simulii]
MNVDNKKCGIIPINCSTDTAFKIQNQPIPYMGCYSILKRNDVPTKFKVMVIKEIIQAAGTYGGILFGMSATRCKPIQKVVDAATQTLAKCKELAAIDRLRQELSLTDLNIKTAVARTRAFGNTRRYAKSGFIEKRFIEECPFCRNIAPETIEHMLLECSRWQALRADILAQYINIYRAQVATKPPLLPASISMRLVGKLLGEELKLSIKNTLNYVFKIRNGTHWTARRYAKSGFIEKRFIEECPFCRNIAPETIEHMLLECSRWQALRADILAQYINIYRAQVATKPPLLPASISMRLVGKLLGEELKLSSTRI